MRALVPILAIAALLVLGCKHQYWTMVSSDEGNTVAVADQPEVTEPAVDEPETTEPEVKPPTPKQIIFTLGIDGMD
ncbi:MAG: hypothetical protein K8I27_14630 [Planctomycetes bacterium]|nr:hypothetical protein [Planctomycetota bacterium]